MSPAILIVLLVLVVLGALPAIPSSKKWSVMPTAALGLLVLVMAALLLVGLVS